MPKVLTVSSDSIFLHEGLENFLLLPEQDITNIFKLVFLIIIMLLSFIPTLGAHTHHPSHRWGMPEGPSLALSFLMEALVAMPRPWGAASRTQSRRAAGLQGSQAQGLLEPLFPREPRMDWQFHSNDVYNLGPRRTVLASEAHGQLVAMAGSPDSRRHETK